MHYDWNFSRLEPYTTTFLLGALFTLLLSAAVIGGGTIIGVCGGFVLRDRWGRWMLRPLIDVLRALPPLVLILCLYFVLSRQVIGMTVTAFWVAVIALSLNVGAFTAELVRAAIENVPVSAVDAARALGMTPRQTARHVIFPIVVREIIPGMTVLYIGVIKMTSLASVINVREVVFNAQNVIADTARSLESWVVVGVVYVVVVVPATYGARRLERWARRGANLGSAP